MKTKKHKRQTSKTIAPIEIKGLAGKVLRDMDDMLLERVKDYTPFQVEELAIKLEFWTKQLRLAAEQMRLVPLVNN